VQTAAGRIYSRCRQLKHTVVSYLLRHGRQRRRARRSIIITAAHCVTTTPTRHLRATSSSFPTRLGRRALEPTSTAPTIDGLLGSVLQGRGCRTTRTFPDNIAWDYAYYVVPDTSASGNTASSDALDWHWSQCRSACFPSVNASGSADFTYFGLLIQRGPQVHVLRRDMTTGANNWWLTNCGLSGGSSGGPWVRTDERMEGAQTAALSVNSWGYTNQPGIAGPKLSALRFVVYSIEPKRGRSRPPRSLTVTRQRSPARSGIIARRAFGRRVLPT
jgi:hypothetical protein